MCKHFCPTENDILANYIFSTYVSRKSTFHFLLHFKFYFKFKEIKQILPNLLHVIDCYWPEALSVWLEKTVQFL